MGEDTGTNVAIIGGGVIGALLARELGKYRLRVALLEGGDDVGAGTTKANSAIVHAGFDAKPGSKKATLNVRGNALMEPLCAALHVPFSRNGSLVVAFEEEDVPTLRELFTRGVANGVPGLRLLNGEELRQKEPNINKEAVAALYAPTGGIVSPYELAVAAAENAVRGGAEFIRNFRVTKIEKPTDAHGTFCLHAQDGRTLEADIVVNAAGVRADDVARLIGDESFHIRARRGEYMLLDKSKGGYVTHTVFQCPTKMGKGILITPTVHGNILIGPTAEDLDDKEDDSATAKGLAEIARAVARTVPDFRVTDVITSFTGLRAHDDKDDFILEPSAVHPRFIHAAGIESPGLSAAPAIAEYTAQQVLEAWAPYTAPGDTDFVKSDWDPGRPKPVRLHAMTNAERGAAIAENPLYGRVVCRCETVSEGEIIDAIRAPAGARDIDGVKRRTRAGMGRCQGGFCGAKVLEILARELALDPTEITKRGGASAILIGKTK
jgi:glycerol-3-phosphate dehydrogenase